jgi:general secretion pathway protein L
MSILASEPLEGLSVRASRALGWWLGELRSAYAEAAHRIAAVGRETLTIEAGERRWVLRCKGGAVGEIDWQAASAEDCRRLLREMAEQTGRRGVLLVEISPERVLSKTIELPAAAQGDLDRILSFEIARHFPFPAERVLHRYRIVGRSGAAAAGAPSLSVEIAAVPREVVLSIAGELAAAGLRASRFALVAAASAAPLFIASATVAGPTATPRIGRRLVIGALVMALAAATSWPVAQQFRLAAMEREIAALKPRAEAVLRAQDQRQRDAAQAAAVARLRAGRPPLIALLDALSEAVPDGSWLTSLSIAGREIVLDGLSPSAATIALTLGKNPDFAAVAYRAPITRDAASGLEHFQFGVTLTEKRR